MKQAERLPSNTGISVDPPRSSNTGLAFKNAELIKSKLLFQLAGHRDTGCSGANDDDWIVRICIVLVAVYASNGVAHVGWR
jgi:hypothetical protein